MNTSSKHLPTLVGVVLLVVGVGVAGASFVQENLPSDWLWLRGLTVPFRWELTPPNGQIDLYLGFNLVPIVFVLVSAVLIYLVSKRVAGGFLPSFFAVWGAVVAGGVVAAILSVLYNKTILDYPSFTPTGGGGILDDLQYGVDLVLDAAAFAGMWVALAVAVAMVLVGPSHAAPLPYAFDSTSSDPTASNPYAGGPLDPSPPMTPLPPTPPPTTVQPSVTPPPPPPPPPPSQGTVDPTIVADDGSTR